MDAHERSQRKHRSHRPGNASAEETSSFGESLGARGCRFSSAPRCGTDPARRRPARTRAPAVPSGRQLPPPPPAPLTGHGARGAARPGSLPARRSRGLPPAPCPLRIRAVPGPLGPSDEATHIVPLDEFDAFLQRVGDADGLELQSVHPWLCPGHLHRIYALAPERRSRGRRQPPREGRRGSRNSPGREAGSRARRAWRGQRSGRRAGEREASLAPEKRPGAAAARASHAAAHPLYTAARGHAHARSLSHAQAGHGASGAARSPPAPPPPSSAPEVPPREVSAPRRQHRGATCRPRPERSGAAGGPAAGPGRGRGGASVPTSGRSRWGRPAEPPRGAQPGRPPGYGGRPPPSAWQCPGLRPGPRPRLAPIPGRPSGERGAGGAGTGLGAGRCGAPPWCGPVRGLQRPVVAFLEVRWGSGTRSTLGPKTGGADTEAPASRKGDGETRGSAGKKAAAGEAAEGRCLRPSVPGRGPKVSVSIARPTDRRDGQ